MNSTPGATAVRWPVLRSSSTIGVSPRARSCSTTTLPMSPAPPVTRMLRAISRFQAEQALQGLEEAVAPPGSRGLLQRDGGVVQQLVEQRLTEVLELGAIFRREVHPP